MHKAGGRPPILTAGRLLLAALSLSGLRDARAQAPATPSDDADPLRPAVAATFEPPPGDPPRAFLDPRDAFSLHDRKLLNRNLFSQLARPEQASRLAAGNDFALATADLGIGTQVEFPSPYLAPFHGYFVLDAFAAVRVMEGVEVNLNLITLNRSASAGYRRGTDVFPGLAAHLEGEIGRPGGRALRGEFLTTDLGEVTLGKGLLIERVPLEGHAARLRWGDVIEINEVFGGEALWLNDDVQTLGLRLFDGALEVNAVTWLLNDVVRADYLTFAAEMPGLGPHFRLAAEGGLRVALSPSAPWAAAGMLRADVIDRHARHGGRWHLGYQFRAYQKNFGPRTGPLIPVQTLPALPTREDLYVSNPALYFNVSPVFDQWSHTVMLELRTPLWWRFEFWAEAEWVLRFARDPEPGSSRVVYEQFDRRFPGWQADIWLKSGVELRPFADLPHRARLLFSNKHVAAFGFGVPQSTGDQYLHQKLISLEFEVFL
jgi:hypothetical protein